MDQTKLNESVINLPGIGEKLKDALSKFKINTIYDLIFAFPFRYEVLKPFTYGEKGVLSGIFETSGIIKTRNNKRMLKAVFRTDYGFISGLWMNVTNDYPIKHLKVGSLYHMYGAVTIFDRTRSIFHPDFISENDLGSVRAIYYMPSALSLTVYRKIISFVLQKYLDFVEETIPPYILDKYNYPEIKDALATIHIPKTDENALEITSHKHPAYERFIYEEFFYLQLAVLMRKKRYRNIEGTKFKIDKSFLDKIKDFMPFKLTGAQRKTLVEIFNDMMSAKQMNRLVQGDVGSGKTVLAFIASMVAVDNGYQAVFIAPTEVLAEQHFKNFQKFFASTGISTCIMTGSVSKKDKSETKSLIASGSIDIVIGTHALLEENVEFAKLGLVVVDEQHRFGVEQRKKLINKGFTPDILLMTATPIPRTLAMTLYGDLDVSIINELPPGRIPLITKAYRVQELNKALDFIKTLLDKCGRAYFVYPLIDESDKVDLKNATQSYEYIKKYYKDKQVGLLHGRMKSDEKRKLLESFKSGALDILVSTTVIEVGVDVPEATVIMIENAERFGLSQLHQLRGRVGRNDVQSYCVLVTSSDISENGRKRINAMVEYSDGFKLAEIDLELRGQGDFFGTKQSGLPEFKYADVINDIKILYKAKNDAEDILNDDESLQNPSNKIIFNNLKRLYADDTSYFGIG